MGRIFRSSSDTTAIATPTPPGQSALYGVITIGGHRHSNGSKVYGDHVASLDAACSLNLISRGVAAERCCKVKLYPETRDCIDDDGSKYLSVGNADFDVYIAGIRKRINAEVVDSQFILTRDGKKVQMQIGRQMKMWDIIVSYEKDGVQRGTVGKGVFARTRYYIKAPDGVEDDKFFLKMSDGTTARCTKSYGQIGKLLALRKGEKVSSEVMAEMQKQEQEKRKNEEKTKAKEFRELHSGKKTQAVEIAEKDDLIEVNGVMYH